MIVGSFSPPRRTRSAIPLAAWPWAAAWRRREARFRNAAVLPRRRSRGLRCDGPRGCPPPCGSHGLHAAAAAAAAATAAAAAAAAATTITRKGGRGDACQVPRRFCQEGYRLGPSPGRYGRVQGSLDKPDPGEPTHNPARRPRQPYNTRGNKLAPCRLLPSPHRG